MVISFPTSEGAVMATEVGLLEVFVAASTSHTNAKANRQLIKVIRMIRTPAEQYFFIYFPIRRTTAHVEQRRTRAVHAQAKPVDIATPVYTGQPLND
jgi:hypothetical protein